MKNILNKFIGEGFLQLNKSDLIKGAFMAMLGAIIAGAIEMLTGISATPPIYPTLAMLSHLVVAGLITGLTYMAKNFISNSNGNILKKEPEKI